MNTISNEKLNAYLDDELDDQERYLVTDALINDPELKARLDEIEQARKLYTSAFSNPPEHSAGNTDTGGRKTGNRKLLAQSLAASLLVAISFFAGSQWTINHADSDNNSHLAAFSSIDTLEQLSKKTGNHESGYKALVHFEQFDRQDALKTLSRIDRALSMAKRNNVNARIEVIMQGKGLGLIRTDTSPVAMEIRNLLARHNNLVIAACNKTLERLKLEKGIKAELLPDVLVVPSALDQILNRLQHDWLYIKA